MTADHALDAARHLQEDRGTPPRRVFVHLGFPKTGTTTIQNVFHARRTGLMNRGQLLYPALSPNLTNALCTAFLDDPLKHISNRMAGRTREEATAWGREQLLALEEEITSSDWRRLVLSAEGLSNLSASDLTGFRSWINQFVPTDQVTVVIFVRDPVKYVTSTIQQVLKGGATLEELYEAPPLPNFKGKISNAVAVFGRQQVVCVPFETAARAEGGLVAAFARVVGLGERRALRLAELARRENESLSDWGAAVLDVMNQIRPLFIDGQRNPARSGRELRYIQMLAGNPFTLPDEVAERVRRLCADDVEWLSETFGVSLYRDVPSGPDRRPLRQPVDRDVAVSIAEVIGELVNRSPRPGPAR